MPWLRLGWRGWRDDLLPEAPVRSGFFGHRTHQKVEPQSHISSRQRRARQRHPADRRRPIYCRDRNRLSGTSSGVAVQSHTNRGQPHSIPQTSPRWWRARCRQRLAHCVGLPFPLFCAAFDVAEEKRNGACRRNGHECREVVQASRFATRESSGVRTRYPWRVILLSFLLRVLGCPIPV